MGRKRKAPVVIKKSDLETEISPELVGLPGMKTFIESRFYHRANDGTKLKRIDRFFLQSPTDQEKADTKALQERGKTEDFSVVVYNINLNGVKIARKHKPLVDSVTDLGFDSAFAENIARIFISKLGNGLKPGAGLQGCQIAILAFLTFVKGKEYSVSGFTLNDLSKEHFEQFKDSLDPASHSSYNSYRTFNALKIVLVDHVSSAVKPWLNALVIGKATPKKPLAEHTSPLFQEEDLYSDAVLYQMLGYFLTQFQSIFDRFEYFNTLKVSDMPNDWWDPRINYRANEDKFKPIQHEYDRCQYIEMLLQEKRYEDILKHDLIFTEVGYSNKRFLSLSTHEKNKINDYKEHQSKYYDYIKNTHNIDATLHNSYLSGFDSSIQPTFHRIMGWCLANILMIQTGINKEVALSIPSLTDSGGSVLENRDTIFLSREQSSEIQLYGYKEKTGSKTSVKMIEAPIQKGGLLHTYLKRYEKYKASSEGPFFEVGSKLWGNALFGSAGRSTFLYLFPILNDHGTPLESIDTRKFRKIYGNAKLLELTEGVESPQELADKIHTILQHNDLDTFLNHYLFNTNRGAAAIDSVIVGITASKLEEALNFKGKIETSSEEQENRKEDNRIKVFLCDCENPFNPSHSEVIHDSCRHYDLCLGCERSIVCQEHLPFICARIIQYQEFREKNVRLWSEFYEDQYMIAHDTLNKYEESGGKEHVKAAWIEAESGKIKLPPLLKGII